MELGKDFWLVLHALALHVEHSPGTKSERRSRFVNAYRGFGPLGRQVARQEMQRVAAELALLQREIANIDEDVPVAFDGDGQR